MATADRIMKLERGIVCSIEKELRQMMNQEKHRRELEEHRQAYVRKYKDLEERKKEVREEKTEEAAARVVESKLRQQRRQEHLEVEREILAAVGYERRVRAMEKYDRMVSEREEVRQRSKAEGEAKREYIRQVKEQLDTIQKAKNEKVSEKIQAGEARTKTNLLKTKLEVESKHQQRELADQRNAAKRQAHRYFEEEMKQQAEEHLRRKYEQSATVQNKKAADLQNLQMVKEKFQHKKREIQELLEEAHRTGDMDKVNEALLELREHQSLMEEKARQEWAERTIIVSPRRRRRPQSAGPSSPGSVTSPMSPTMPGYLTRRSPRPVSANASRSPATADFSQDRTVSPRRSTRRSTSPDIQKNLPPPGAHYDHLMSMFKGKLYYQPKEPVYHDHRRPGALDGNYLETNDHLAY